MKRFAVAAMAAILAACASAPPSTEPLAVASPTVQAAPPPMPQQQDDVAPIAGDRQTLLKDLELALFAGKIAAYAQGFAVMAGASKEFGWNLPMPTIARIWRAGCIIRSAMLDTMAEAFASGGAQDNL